MFEFMKISPILSIRITIKYLIEILSRSYFKEKLTKWIIILKESVFMVDLESAIWLINELNNNIIWIFELFFKSQNEDLKLGFISFFIESIKLIKSNFKKNKNELNLIEVDKKFYNFDYFLENLETTIVEKKLDIIEKIETVKIENIEKIELKNIELNYNQKTVELKNENILKR
jgi:hypothetical protein